ncbi:hypothetical protein JYU34_022777, partial [Plutella xylostella]
ARTHSIERREANPEVNYDDQPLSDAAADDDTQNDADQGNYSLIYLILRINISKITRNMCDGGSPIN